jgi:hypothetical protein
MKLVSENLQLLTLLFNLFDANYTLEIRSW